MSDETKRGTVELVDAIPDSAVPLILTAGSEELRPQKKAQDARCAEWRETVEIIARVMETLCR